VELQPPGLIVTVYVPAPVTDVLAAEGEVIVPGPAHEYVGEPADVAAVTVAVVDPQGITVDEIDAVGGAVPVIGEIKIY